MNKSIPERIFVWEDEMNEFLLGKRKQVQIGINQDPVRGLLTYVRRNVVVQPEVDLEKEINLCWINWLSPSNQKEVEGVLPKTEFEMYARHFYELGLNARKEE